MKKNGILNSNIAKVLADLGHTDQIIICDAGLPIPANVEKIDLAIELGTPSFLAILEVLNQEMAIEKVILAAEIKEKNELVYSAVADLFPDISFVSHEEFKRQSQKTKAIIRTGEATPFANIILQAGVLF